MEFSELTERFLRYKTSRIAASTLSKLSVFYNAFNNWAAGRKVTRTLINEWFEAQAKAGKRHSTMQKEFQSFVMLYRYGRDQRCQTGNPVPKRLDVTGRPSKPRQAMLEDEYKRLLVCASDERFTNPEWPGLITLAWETPLRLSDCAMMSWDKIDLSASSIKLIPYKTRRWGKSVEIPLAPALEQLFRKIYANRDHDQWVFPLSARHYTMGSHTDLCQQFNEIRKRAGVKKSFHSFRHSFITRHTERGVSPALIADLAGISLAMVMTYTHPSLESKRIAMFGKPSEAFKPLIESHG